MLHLGTKTIETKRLILRKYSLDDAEDMFNNWASNPNVTKFMTWQPYTNVAEVENYICQCIKGYESDSNYNWIIEYKENSQAIGSISVVDFNELINCASVGYCIGEEYWHKGITTEAFKSVIKFLFEEVGVNRIEAYHDVNNPHSGGVMKKSGLTYEGTHRQSAFANQRIYDKAFYAYLKDDYFKRSNTSFSLADKQNIQKELHKKYKDKWGELSPQIASDLLLYMFIEAGEVGDVIKKNGDESIMNNSEIRKHFIEEMCDVMMYFNDILLCYEVSPEEFEKVYREKHSKNMNRW